MYSDFTHVSLNFTHVSPDFKNLLSNFSYFLIPFNFDCMYLIFGKSFDFSINLSYLSESITGWMIVHFGRSIDISNLGNPGGAFFL